MTQSRFSCWLKGQSKGALGGLAMGQQLAAVGEVDISGSWITGPFSALVHGLKVLGCFWVRTLEGLWMLLTEEHWKNIGRTICLQTGHLQIWARSTFPPSDQREMAVLIYHSPSARFGCKDLQNMDLDWSQTLTTMNQTGAEHITNISIDNK